LTSDEHGSWKSVDILLVEDNPGDMRLMIELLKEGKVRNQIASLATVSTRSISSPAAGRTLTPFAPTYPPGLSASASSTRRASPGLSLTSRTLMGRELIRRHPSSP
jgi:hypothetical protein